MRLSGVGHALLGFAAAGLAILGLAYGNLAGVWGPLPDRLPGAEAWIYAASAILLIASAGLFYVRTARVSAIIIGICQLIWVLSRAYSVLLKPMEFGSWYGICEAMGPLLGTLILHTMLRRQFDAPTAAGAGGERALHVARVLFGAACVVYGAAHFVYAKYTAAMVPAWLPGRTELAYLTGAAHAAAGFGLLLGILPRLAATLEAIMMSLFGVFVWLPSFFAQPVPIWATPTQNQWSETVVTFLLAAAAWIVAASLRSNPPNIPERFQTSGSSASSSSG